MIGREMLIDEMFIGEIRWKKVLSKIYRIGIDEVNVTSKNQQKITCRYFYYSMKEIVEMYV